MSSDFLGGGEEGRASEDADLRAFGHVRARLFGRPGAGGEAKKSRWMVGWEMQGDGGWLENAVGLGHGPVLIDDGGRSPPWLTRY